MDSNKTEKFYSELERTNLKTKLIINDNLGLVWSGTFEAYNNNVIEDRDHILNSEILDYKYDEKNDVFEMLIDYGSLEWKLMDVYKYIKRRV